ncbi:hypothetical protein QA646_18325 [Rhizobium sp. CB3090]|uniref:hypothetical protein n=1 Tax=Rhizobium sp. CB3090 TaxID=3039156 RepID=UPI0024B15654|nr:hypothetical protein [Rhizobium sp. CB3090]WFU09198.1 hypothetical protein QA646_18325 [Rhizobium sp. CB3090]
MSGEYIPLIVTVLGLVGAAITYTYQRNVDRKTTLMELRRKAYRDYLRAFLLMTGTPERDEEIQNSLLAAEFELLVVGSDQVVKCVGALSQYYAETNHDRFNRSGSKVRSLVAEVCRAMRQDCFEGTDLSIDEIQAIVPIV